MTTILPPLPDEGKARLRVLIEALKAMPPKDFDFSIVIEKRECGTVCCAIGLTPQLFPDLVEAYWHSENLNSYNIRKIGDIGGSVADVSNCLFGMSYGDSFVFWPEQQKAISKHLPTCREDATPQEVAAMLEKYIELTETPAGPAIAATKPQP